MRSNKILSVDELWQFFNFPSSLYVITSPDGCIHHVNPSFSTLLGYSEEEFPERSYLQIVHPDDRALTQRKMEDLKRHRTITFRNRCITKSGSCKHISWALTYSDKYNMIYANAQDHSEQFLLEAELQRQKADKHKNILEATVQGQEMEKVAIGRELHDNINQLLTSVNLYMKMAMQNEPIREEVLTKARDIQSKAIEEIRVLSKAMIAPQVTEVGLIESIEELLGDLRDREGLHIDFHHEGFSEAIPARIKLMLFRIVQEKTTNIVKYAKASNVFLLLTITRKHLKLVIQDDGVGFNTTEKRNGIGFRNIVARTEVYNGTVDLKSAPGKGCRLCVDIPVSEVFGSPLPRIFTSELKTSHLAFVTKNQNIPK